MHAPGGPTWTWRFTGLFMGLFTCHHRQRWAEECRRVMRREKVNVIPESGCNLHSTIEIADIPAGECGSQKARVSRLPLLLAALRYNEMGHPGAHLKCTNKKADK